jgi:hypothetical protein
MYLFQWIYVVLKVNVWFYFPNSNVQYLFIFHYIERRAIAQSIENQDPGKMAFTLLTKKGNRQQVGQTYNALK